MGRPRNIFIVLEDGVHDDDKTLDLARLTGWSVDVCVSRLTAFWLWLMRTRAKDDITDVDPSTIEHIFGWDGEPGALFDALKKTRWVKCTGRKTKRIKASGWDRLNGRFLKERQRKLNHYNRKGRNRLDVQKDVNSPSKRTEISAEQDRTGPDRIQRERVGGGGGNSVAPVPVADAPPEHHPHRPHPHPADQAGSRTRNQTGEGYSPKGDELDPYRAEPTSTLLDEQRADRAWLKQLERNGAEGRQLDELQERIRQRDEVLRERGVGPQSHELGHRAG